MSVNNIPEVQVENVLVVVRVRPMDEIEYDNGAKNIIMADTIARTITICKPKAAATDRIPPKCYSFDNVFDVNSSQIDVYVESARPIVDKVLEGYNGSILVYGQTGSGKTYTMTGYTSSPQSKGIIPNTFAHIFGHIGKSKTNLQFLVRVSYMEIYNEEVRDLLGKELNKSLEVKERADIGVFVKDLSGYVVHNADDLNNIMKIGNKKRVVGATKMNVESSRSHAIFSITIESSAITDIGEQHLKMGKLQLVDLAGSERQCRTQASGVRLKEATKINQSLSVLGNVISALVDGKSTHIPYRNSKLTRLLQDSLGGNSKTVMCATISPACSNYIETISTLRYACRAKGIQNRMHINEEPKDALLRHFQEEILELKRQLEESLFEIDSSEEFNGQKRECIGETDSEHDYYIKEKVKYQIVANEKQLLDERALENQNELNKTKYEQRQIKAKLISLETKILIGGENLLEKVDEQEKILENSILELELRTKAAESLKLSLQKKVTERIDIKERYSSLQEAANGRTKKLHRVMQMLMGVKDELSDQQQEHQREKEAIYENIRSLSRELALCEFVLNSYIPKQYQKMAEQFTNWNEDIGEWQLKCVAYTGNNMRKLCDERNENIRKRDFFDLSTIYLCYNEDTELQTTNKIAEKSRFSGVPRPTSNPAVKI